YYVKRNASSCGSGKPPFDSVSRSDFRHEDHERLACAERAPQQADIVVRAPGAGARPVDFEGPLAAFGLQAALDRTGQPVEVMETAFRKLFAQVKEGFGLLLVERPGTTGFRFSLGCPGTVRWLVVGRCDLQNGDAGPGSRRTGAGASAVDL